MTYSFFHLNWIAILATTVVGFLIGWLWYSPMLFVKPWLAERKVTEEQVKEMMSRGMGGTMLKGFLWTLVSTIGLATLIRAHVPLNAGRGALYGGFVGLLVVGARFANTGVWEMRSAKLQAINIGYEVLLFAVQGAILTVWW